jgi:hypothetical protein
MDSFVMNYDPDTDMVRVRTDASACDAVAVPLEDLTILISHSLDQVVGVNIDDLPTFVERYVSNQLSPMGARGEALFIAAKPHLEALVALFTRNLGPVAKDRVAHWDEFISAYAKKRGFEA